MSTTNGKKHRKDPEPLQTIVNTQGEKLTFEQVDVRHTVFGGQILLVVHDDPPPRGSGIRAPMLADPKTVRILRATLDRLFDEDGERIHQPENDTPNHHPNGETDATHD